MSNYSSQYTTWTGIKKYNYRKIHVYLQYLHINVMLTFTEKFKTIWLFTVQLFVMSLSKYGNLRWPVLNIVTKQLDKKSITRCSGLHRIQNACLNCEVRFSGPFGQIVLVSGDPRRCPSVVGVYGLLGPRNTTCATRHSRSLRLGGGLDRLRRAFCRRLLLGYADCGCRQSRHKERCDRSLVVSRLRESLAFRHGWIVDVNKLGKSCVYVPKTAGRAF